MSERRATEKPLNAYPFHVCKLPVKEQHQSICTRNHFIDKSTDIGKTSLNQEDSLSILTIKRILLTENY